MEKQHDQNIIKMTGDFHKFSEDSPMGEERKYLWHLNGEDFSNFSLGPAQVAVVKAQFLELWWNWAGLWNVHRKKSEFFGKRI